MNTFGHYRGRCTGRILNVLNEYVPMHIVESVTVGDKVIKLGTGRHMKVILYWLPTNGKLVQIFRFSNLLKSTRATK